MNEGQRQLPIPAPALEDEKAFELARAWVAGGRLHMSVATQVWKDPFCWGIMLVDLAKHVSQAYELTDGVDSSSALNRIKSGFDAEWSGPTDVPTGGLFNQSE